MFLGIQDPSFFCIQIVTMDKMFDSDVADDKYDALELCVADHFSLANFVFWIQIKFMIHCFKSEKSD